MVYKQKLTFGVIVATRNIFNSKLAQEGRMKIITELEKMDFGTVILPAEATPTGAVETLEDARKCAELFSLNRNKIDGIIITLPNFGDELGVINTLKYAELNVPILVHAEDDDNNKVDVKSRRDAFCGKLSVCNNLYQYGIPFTDTAEHTCDVDGECFAEDIKRFTAVCRVVKGLKAARIGAFGTRPAAFQTVRYSEKLLQDSGITVVPVDLSEIIKGAEALSDIDGDVQAKLAKIREYGNIPSRIVEASIIKQAKLSVVIDR